MRMSEEEEEEEGMYRTSNDKLEHSSATSLHEFAS